MKRASLAAAFAASLLFGSASVCMAADDARTAEERLLGSADEEARFGACQPFTREIAADGVVSDSLDASLAQAGVPAATMLEASRAFGTAIDLKRDVQPGDRFHVRYEQTFTAEGAPIGVGRVLWTELRTKAKGTIALHRFRPLGGVERLWLTSGEAATPPSIRLPLDAVNVSSGFGLRPDPLDKPGTALAMGPLPDPAPSPAAGNAGAPAPEQPVAAPREEPAKPARRHAVRGSLGFGPFGLAGQTDPRAIHEASRFELERLVAERAAHARAAAARPAADATEARQEQAKVAPPPAARPLFMHDGVDLVAPSGTAIYAAADGIVMGAEPNGRYGNWIRIHHPGGFSTVYGHLSDFAPDIEAGVRVSQGELIGFVGNTGRSTGAHLHFEILSSGKAVNPLVHPEIKRAQLRGADLERFRRQVKRALAERDRETAIALSSSGL